MLQQSLIHIKLQVTLGQWLEISFNNELFSKHKAKQLLERGSQCYWSLFSVQVHYVAAPPGTYRNVPASASQVLGLQMCITMPG